MPRHYLQPFCYLLLRHPPTSHLHTLSLHDALPISSASVTRCPDSRWSVPAPLAITAPGIVRASATARRISSLAVAQSNPIPRCEVSMASATARPSDQM